MLLTFPDESSFQDTTDNPLKFIQWINFGDLGWSEYYYLPTDDVQTAYLTCQEIMRYRSWLLCPGTVIEWACLRQESPPWWEWPTIGAAVPDPGRWGPCHTPEEGLHVNYRTAGKRWGNRILKGIPFDQFVAAKLDPAPYRIPTAGLTEPDPMTADWPTLWRWFHYFVQRQTCHADPRVDPYPTVPHPWSRRSWELANFRGATTQDVSAAVRRVSWEPDILLPRPPFTPCGQAVTALRACYQSQVRFFTGGPVQKITYYWAKPGVDVFPERHIFWGWRRDMDTRDLGGPGELVRHRQYLFAPGYSFGDAPGDHYCGLLSDFLGLRVWPPADPLPAEITCLDGCDVPVPLPIKFRLSDNSVHQDNTQIATFDVADFTAEEVGPNEFVIHAKCGCDDLCTSDCTYWTTDVPWASPTNPFAIKFPTWSSSPPLSVTIPFLTAASDKFSIAGWHKRTANSGTEILWMIDPVSPPDFGMLLYLNCIDPPCQMVFEDRSHNTIGHYRQAKSDFVAEGSDWHHYGVSYDYSNYPWIVKFYFDGTLVTTTITDDAISTQQRLAQKSYIGDHQSTNDAYFDDWRIFDGTILSGSDYLDLFNRTSVLTPTHHYKMDEGAGVLVHDTGSDPMPGYIPACLSPSTCLPTGIYTYGGLVVGGKVISLGSPITEIICEMV